MKYYKAVAKNRRSHWDGVTEWRVGKLMKVDNPDLHDNTCGRGIHFSPTLLDAVSYQTAPSRYYEVDAVKIIASDSKKLRGECRVIREIKRQEMDKLTGLKLHEANNPVNPLLLKGKVLPDFKKKKLLKEWDSVRASVRASVWASVRASVWASVGDSVGASVRDSVWASVGASVGDSVWASVGASVGDSVRASVWASVGASVWDSVRASVGASVWAYCGGLFPNIKTWKYVEDLGDNPWKPLLTLWYSGYVPSFDGGTWRLHSGPKAETVFSVMQKELDEMEG